MVNLLNLSFKMPYFLDFPPTSHWPFLFSFLWWFPLFSPPFKKRINPGLIPWISFYLYSLGFKYYVCAKDCRMMVHAQIFPSHCRLIYPAICLTFPQRCLINISNMIKTELLHVRLILTIVLPISISISPSSGQITLNSSLTSSLHTSYLIYQQILLIVPS